MNLPPTITTHPQSRTVTAGASVDFSVAASGTALLSYQWRFNGQDMRNATNATLSLVNVHAPLRIGTLNAILNAVAEAKDVRKEAVLQKLSCKAPIE